MQEQELARIWSDTCALLQNQMSDMTYGGWIKPLVPLYIDGRRFVFMVQNDYQLTFVRQRYSVIIEEALEQVTGRHYTVALILESERDRVARPYADRPKITLNPKYTFESFVVGSSNRFAQAAAEAVAKNIGTAYNPLFIYGGVGLGKTHLMHAIGNHIMRSRPDTKLLYVTSEAFTNDLINAIQTKKNIEFRERYRTLDVLLIDDIQFIVGRESTQEEIFHTFNALYDDNKQIVLSSDKHPKDIPTLEERLVSRFESGLVADIQKPDFETTMAILRKKAESESFPIPDDVFVYIAQRVFSSVREMEGCLTSIIAYASLVNQPLTVGLAEEAISRLRTAKDARSINADLISNEVARYFGINVLDMKSQKRQRDIAVPRQIAMYLMREMLSLSLPRIGAEFGGRDHTTVMYACDKIAAELKTDIRLKQSLDDIRKRISEP